MTAGPSTPPMDPPHVAQALTTEEFVTDIKRIHAHVSRVIQGKPEAISMAILALLARGHLLLEDVPGVGKTTLAKSLAASVGGSMHRIQFTPDLLPSDVTGGSIYNLATRQFEFRKGPVFANVVLADEINRTSPKTQSALLECMAEAQVSVDGRTYRLEEPFFVIATQSPIEMSGTYALPEPQRDRFLARISIGYPDAAAEAAMLSTQAFAADHFELGPVVDLARIRRLIRYVAGVHAAEAIRRYVVALTRGTRAHPTVSLGASPRASIHLLRAACARAALTGRRFVVPDDVQALAEPVLAHRVILRPDAVVAGTTPADVVREVVSQTPLPRTDST